MEQVLRVDVASPEFRTYKEAEIALDSYHSYWAPRTHSIALYLKQLDNGNWIFTGYRFDK